MSDLIDRRLAIEIFCDKECGFKPKECMMYPCYQIELIRSVPISELEIIRCRDCKWWTNQSTTLQGKCKLHGLNPMPEWYCASGEANK